MSNAPTFATTRPSDPVKEAREIGQQLGHLLGALFGADPERSKKIGTVIGDVMAGTIIVENPPRTDPPEELIMRAKEASSTSGMALSGRDAVAVLKTPAFWIALATLVKTAATVADGQKSGNSPAPEEGKTTYSEQDLASVDLEPFDGSGF